MGKRAKKGGENRRKAARYCPFKKQVKTELNGYDGRKVLYERFARCAGERCMAFLPGGGCRRLRDPKD